MVSERIDIGGDCERT